jgi:hypothetical protein
MGTTVVDTKICSACGIEKPVTEFYADKRLAKGVQCRCKLCMSDYGKERYKINPLPQQKGNIARYGITMEQYEDMFEAQKGVCAICGRPETAVRKGVPQRLAIDHDHACCSGGKSCGQCVRGLLCQSCNHLLGNAGDNPERLIQAVRYLEGWGE